MRRPLKRMRLLIDRSPEMKNVPAGTTIDPPAAAWSAARNAARSFVTPSPTAPKSRTSTQSSSDGTNAAVMSSIRIDSTRNAPPLAPTRSRPKCP